MKREIFISFAGHLVVILGVGFLTTWLGQRPRVTARPTVITVEILRGGIKTEKEQKPETHLAEPVPRPAPAKKKEEPKRPESKPAKKNEEMVRRAGLGAKVEGVAALGYNYYLQQMLERIGANWTDPYGNGRQLKATVMFVIERDGRLTEIKLERGSGDELFDEACVRAVTVTGKLPPLPNEFTAPRLKIHLEFER